jgi:2-methylisocitrate lyase-like PEP mutase family enzyme
MMNFALLHRQDGPLLIANVWDVSSARTAQAAGYQAIGTSSAAIAAMYGYDDGDGITLQNSTTCSSVYGLAALCR